MASFPYPALVFSQRESAKIAFCMISAPVGEILSWARVDRLESDNLAGVQRREKESKTRSIRQFLGADDRNTIPTALTIALPFSAVTGVDANILGQTTTAPTAITITIEAGEDLPGLIIDGQHRIFGINAFDPRTPVSVVLLLGAEDEEIAFQFLVINNKVSKVSPDHMRALKLAYQQSDLDTRLTKSARMKSNGAPTYLETIDTEADSPFKGRLNWPRNPETNPFRLIPPNAFEAALLHLSQELAVTSADAETKNYDSVVDFFLEVWRAVKEVWPEAWSEANSRLLSKVGVMVFSQYLVDHVIAKAEALDQVEMLKDLQAVSEAVKDLLKRQVYAFWTSPWSSSGLDTDVGRSMILKDLKRIPGNVRNGKDWFDSLTLIDSLNS